MATRIAWSRAEVNLIVDDYLMMLGMELRGEPYSKAQHRDELRPKLNGRTNGSVELKHCNISTALRDSQRPFIDGYKPRTNSQAIVAEVLEEKWGAFATILSLSNSDDVSSHAEMMPSSEDNSNWVSDIVSCVDPLDEFFSLDQVYAFEWQLSSFHPDNNNVRPKIRQILQRMRDAGLIEFLNEAGTYRKTDLFPGNISIIEIESSESTDPFESTTDVPDDPATRYLRSITNRRGAPKFRRGLLRLYDSRCAITGDGPIEVLEAAHIEPHSVKGRNSFDNGLLLRADIHTLFDEGLLWIDPKSLTVRIDKKLQPTSYANLEGKRLRSRTDGTLPSQVFLALRSRDK